MAEVDLSHLQTAQRPELLVVQATEAERAAHEARLRAIEEAHGQCIWKSLADA